jgi:mutator protein MutT
MDIALALILHPTNHKVLIARRRKGVHLADYWEFPGGKMEANETAIDCAVREAKEEVGLAVVPISEPFAPVAYDYAERSVVLYPVLCQAQSDGAMPLASDSVRWVAIDALSENDFPPANAQIVRRLREISEKTLPASRNGRSQNL